MMGGGKKERNETIYGLEDRWKLMEDKKKLYVREEMKEWMSWGIDGNDRWWTKGNDM